MSTLAEIEAAVPGLSTEELEHLESRLKELRQKRAEAHKLTPRDLAEFAGVMHLPEDPLAWQRRMREEWE